MRIKFILGILALVIMLGSFNVSADEAEDLRRQIEERNANIKALEVEIAKYQAEADKTSKAALTLANTIKTLQTTVKKLDTDIKLTQTKISAANLNILKLSNDIGDKENRIRESKKAISENLKLLNQSDAFTPIHSFLSNKNIGETWNSIEQLLGLQSTLRTHISELDGTKAALEEDKHETEEKKNELSAFSTVLSDQKKVVAANTAEQNSILSETKSQEAAYQSLVAQRKAAKAALEKEIFEYESKLKYILDPSSIPSAGSQPFSWPTTDVYITQQFGKTSASGRLYASGSHNGLDLKALMGTPIKAMADGTIAGAGDTDLTCPRASFGKWILIKHTNGLAATFAHMSVISVKEGSAVKRGDIIGYSGNTGYSTGPHLHISVYPNDAVTAQSRPSAACGGKTYYMPIAAVNAYLDPLAYLPAL
jgi:murein DD-endopeptidase MepM/ murein hydrolase activator NlpD